MHKFNQESLKEFKKINQKNLFKMPENAENPILFFNPMSPPSRAVLLTAKEIGLNLDIR